VDQGASKTEAQEFPDQVQLKFEGLEFSSNSRDGGGISRSVSGNSRPSPGAFLAGALAGARGRLGSQEKRPALTVERFYSLEGPLRGPSID
jgi:hypothetical protein